MRRSAPAPAATLGVLARLAALIAVVLAQLVGARAEAQPLPSSQAVPADSAPADSAPTVSSSGREGGKRPPGASSARAAQSARAIDSASGGAPSSPPANGAPAAGSPPAVGTPATAATGVGPATQPSGVTGGIPLAPSSPTPRASSSASVVTTSNVVRLRDRRVFTVAVGRAGLSADARARAASEVLEKAVDEPETPEVRVEDSGGVLVIFVGQRPLIQLGPEDAEAASDVTLEVHAAIIAGKVRDALGAERQRSAIAKAVFSFSLLVFTALLALLLGRETGRAARRAHTWLQANPERVPGLTIQGIEVVRPAAVRGLVSVSVSLGRLLALIAVTYSWVLFALSLFDATRDYSGKLSGFVLSPFSTALRRTAGSFPVVFVVVVALLAVVVLARFVGLFFDSVARGETSVGWLSRDLARTTGVVVRVVVWVTSFLVLLPMLTGNEDGAFSRVGLVALVSIGLAATPVLATAAVGVTTIYGRRLRVGEYVDLGGRSGRITAMTLLDIRLEDGDGFVVRVPHLLALVHATRVLGRKPLVSVELSVAAGAEQRKVRAVLEGAAASLGVKARAELRGLDEGGAHYRVSVVSDGNDARTTLLAVIADSLAEAAIALGRPPPSTEARPR